MYTSAEPFETLAVPVAKTIRGLNIGAPSWDQCDSYGIIAHNLLAQLVQREPDWYINTLSLSDDVPNDQLQILFGGFKLGYPTNFYYYGPTLSLGPQLAITGWESTIIPEMWAALLNKMNHILVWSTFVEEVFKNNGITAPITVTPLGLDHEAYRFQRSRYKALKDKSRPFRVLAFGDRDFRKGWLLAIQAFNKVFGPDANAELHIKIRKDSKSLAARILSKQSQRNIRVIQEDYTAEQLGSFYGNYDVLLFPSYGEGFGLIPREFAATGGISLVTNWSGLTDDLNNWGIGIDYTLTPAWTFHPKFKGLCGDWAKAEVEDMADKLAAIHSMRPKLRLDLGLTVSEFAHKTYNWFRYGEVAHRIFTNEAQKF